MSQVYPPPPQVEVAQPPPKARKRLFAYFGANSLAVSILLHILFGVGATYLIVEHFQKKKVNFHATEPPAQHTEVEHKIEMAKRNNVESAPPDLKRIVTTEISPITLPDIPQVPQNDETTPTAVSGIDGDLGVGAGAGLGTGQGVSSGGGSEPSPFGVAGGSGFVGNLYDLKQTSEGKPTGVTPIQYHQIMEHFVDENWDPNVLRPYYKGSKTLSTQAILIPTMDAQLGPTAFGMEKEVQPSRWLIWYKVKVTAPESGRYRFAGICDDILLVRLDGRTVLNGSLNPFHDVPYKTPWKAYPGNAPLREGEEFNITAGETKDMDVIIGEEPGGIFYADLVIMKVDQTYPTDDATGVPIFPLFRIGLNYKPPEQAHLNVQINGEPWQQVSDP